MSRSWPVPIPSGDPRVRDAGARPVYPVNWDTDKRRVEALFGARSGTERGQLRALSVPDLIIAAAAERHRVCVLHYHGKYEHVASITGQATRWVVPEGSIA